MAIPPGDPRGLWHAFAPVFTRPTWRRFLTLLGAAVLTVGRRAVANLLRTAGALAPGASSSYRRVLSKARWSPLRPAEVLARRVVDLLPGLRRDRPGGRRHGLRPSRPPRLRQGPASRPGPLVTRLHRLAVRPQMGRARRSGPLLVRRPALGPAGPDRVVSRPGRRPSRAATASHAGPARDPALVPDAPLVPRPPVRVRRRFGPRDA